MNTFIAAHHINILQISTNNRQTGDVPMFNTNDFLIHIVNNLKICIHNIIITIFELGNGRNKLCFKL